MRSVKERRRGENRSVRIALLFLSVGLVASVQTTWGLEQKIEIVEPIYVYFNRETTDAHLVYWEATEYCGWGALNIELLLDGGYDTGGWEMSAIDNIGVSGIIRISKAAIPEEYWCNHRVTLRAKFFDNWPYCDRFIWVESNPFALWIDNLDTDGVLDGTAAACNDPPNCKDSSIASPVDVASGKMYYESEDLRIDGPISIEFTRRYDSQTTRTGALGYGWRHRYMMNVEHLDIGGNVYGMIDEKFRPVEFSSTSTLGVWGDNTIFHMTLTQGTEPPWRVRDKHGKTHDFDTAGKLTRIADENGNAITCSYTDGRLTSVMDSSGRAIALSYDGDGHLQAISTGGRTVTYGYTGDNLTRVDYPDGSFNTYEYADPNDPHNLTAVRDALGRVVEMHTYDASDKVRVTETDGGNSRYTLTYDSSTQTTVTDALGHNTVFTLDAGKGVATQITGPLCESCGGGGTGTTIAWDRFFNRTSMVDGSGVVTQLTYDDKGNVLTRTEAAGTNRERTWTYMYDPTFSLPATTEIATVGACELPDKIVTNTYDPATGNKLTEQVTGCNGTESFAYMTTWTYDSHGQVASVDGPRTDVSDVTIYTYYPDDDADVNLRGRLHTVTNALGQQTTYGSYDALGNVGSVTDPNGVETTYLYDGGGRLLETRVKGATPDDDIVTENHYDVVGNLDFVRDPNCVAAGTGCAFSTDYVYDTVNRLTEIRDPLGNKIVYGYDAEGNRIREEHRDSSGAVRKFTNFAYDAYNRLQYAYFTDTPPEELGSIFYKYTYYPDGTKQSEQDPEGHVTTFFYDEIKHLTTVTQTTGGQAITTTYGYDVQDNLVSVTDPNGRATSYTNSDMGWRLSTASPDTGTTTHGYDPAGNLTTATDANGITSARTYDALNRPTGVSYPDSSLNVTQSYDSPLASFGIGRRTGMTDPSGLTTYGYDRRGLLAREDKTIGATTYRTDYGYDKTGNLTEILYPADASGERRGRTSYSYDAANRVSLVAADVSGVAQTVASDFSYEPFGPRTAETFGNGLVDSRSYDSRYRLGTWTLGAMFLNYTHSWDEDSNLIGVTDNWLPERSRIYGYDELHRLTFASGLWGTGTGCGGATYTYDPNGNRLCKGEGLLATTYAYTAGTNRLESTSGAETAAFGYDANGNTVSDGTHTYEYTQANRLASVDGTATAMYFYDGDGRRAIKSASGAVTYYFYDPSGKLLTEAVPAAGSGKDYVYLDGAPIGRVDWTLDEVASREISGTEGFDISSDASLGGAGVGPFLIAVELLMTPAEGAYGSTISDADIHRQLPASKEWPDTAKAVFVEPPDDDPPVPPLPSPKPPPDPAPPEALYFYHTDHLGTPVAMTDEDGNIPWRAEYLPFGGVWSLSVSTVPNHLRFPGQYFDGETGLHENGFRDYSCSSGRYLESDPLGTQDGRGGLYLYASNNPITWLDFYGLNANEWTFGEIGACAIVSLRHPSRPSGLADAKASIAACCGRGESCKAKDGSLATEPGDQAAWKNIVSAVGGADLTGGGRYMCVGHERCGIVHECYYCCDGKKKVRERGTNLPPSGEVMIGATDSGCNHLYFYVDPNSGWCPEEKQRNCK